MLKTCRKSDQKNGFFNKFLTSVHKGDVIDNLLMASEQFRWIQSIYASPERFSQTIRWIL